LAVPAIVVCALVVSACGGDDDATSSSSAQQQQSTAAAPSSTTKAPASTTVDYTQRPTSVGVTEPVGKPIPSGKTIAWVNCTNPQCVTAGKELQAAGRVLGWDVKTIAPTGADVSSSQAAFEQALALKPDAIAYILGAFPTAVIHRQLQKAADAKIPIFPAAATEPGVPGLVGIVYGTEYLVKSQEAAGEYAGSKVSAGMTVGLPTVLGYSPAATAATNAAITAGVKKTCPTCTTKVVPIPPSQIPDAPKIIANAARTNPKMKWIQSSLDSVTGKGLTAALRGAGLTDVKFAGTGAIEDGVQRVRDGEEEFVEVYPIRELGWQVADMMARHFVGASVAPDAGGAGPNPWLITKSTVPPTNTFPVVADYQQQFERLWGK
jgi:ribose transport system substrate-binding protein